MTTNQCYNGDFATFKPKVLEDHLRNTLQKYHTTMKNNTSLAARWMKEKHQFVSFPKHLPYCNKCGFVGNKSTHIKQHVNSKSNLCSETDIRPGDGTIMSNEYGFLVPNSVLERIVKGDFILPTKQCSMDSDTLLRSTRQTNNQTPCTSQMPPDPPVEIYATMHHSFRTNDRSQPNNQLYQRTEPSSSQPSTLFLPSDADISFALSTNSPYNDSVSLNSFIIEELVNAFGNKENADRAHDYLTSFILLIDQRSPGLLKNLLSGYATMFKAKQNDVNMQIILEAGKKWLQSNSANLDVRMVPVHHRNGIYLVGNTFLESDKDLQKGSTFVWSENVDSIYDQFHSLLTFAHETKWPTMSPYLDKISDLLMQISEHTNDDTQDEFDLTASKLINTNILFGLLNEILLEQPCTPNGPNLIYRYLAGATVRKNHNNDLIVRNANEISKHANALLRLLRHGICSMYVRKSQIMAHQNESHKNFEVWANKLISDIQVCPSIGHICRTLRTAREVDRKTPSTIQKAFNDKTGELYVSGHQIHKSTWSMAIPTAIAQWDKYLHILFPNHSQGSTLSLDTLFHLDNAVVIAGNDSYVSITTNTSQSVPLQHFIPMLSA